MKLHLGCGDIHREDMLNVDVRQTSATDMVRDCARLDWVEPGSCDLVFSCAFLEHLFPRQVRFHLAGACQALKPDGRLVYLNIPDYEKVAELYTNGMLSLSQATHWTLGDPGHQMSFPLEQAHKGLYSAEHLADLVEQAGFGRGLVFRYCWRNEPHPVNLGVVASKRGAVSRQDAIGLVDFVHDDEVAVMWR